MGDGRVVVVHGYGATPASNWFGWVREELAPEGVDVAIPELPDTDAPQRGPWVATLVATLGTPDERTFVVAHSMGAPAALLALDRIPGPWRLGGLILVAGFATPIAHIPEIAPFTRPPADLARTMARTSHRLVVHSDDDVIVPPGHSAELGELLQAQVAVVPRAGHFLDGEGFTRLPLVVEHLRSWLEPGPPSHG